MEMDRRITVWVPCPILTCAWEDQQERTLAPEADTIEYDPSAWLGHVEDHKSSLTPWVHTSSAPETGGI